ncbi:dephospho-CoA kinase [Sulfobacillus thermosulfidooxidans]|uniref:dephospho-CoA kinase n=1 Tax=Sulfobacillus thermosulfidooxidans TaxID=28034 RepID=UPI0006B5B80C|nr:dephospho-CoA kinase [Sulfobacillus thermosulfidooxidans]
MRVIGLTGSIGTGKSEVSRILQELGAQVIDADRLTHHLQQRGQEVWRAIWQHYGWSILGPDGQLLRRKLGHRIFLNPLERQGLNAIVHPVVQQHITRQLAELSHQGYRVAVIDMPLLIEGNWRHVVDEIWVVYAPLDLQLQRVVERDHLGKEEALRRIQAQMPIDEKLRYADYVIDNQGSLERLREQVTRLWRNANATV